MKKLILLLLVVLTSTFHSFSQDYLYKTNGDKIAIKILEKDSEYITYRLYESRNTSAFQIPVKQVYMISYENGETEMFNKDSNSPNSILEVNYEIGKTDSNISVNSGSTSRGSNPNNQYQNTNNLEQKTPERKSKENEFTIGSGYGNSYGGYGVRAQLRIGGNMGFGFHGGVGYYPNAPVRASGGVKFFPYKFIYINTQFGLTGTQLNLSDLYSGSYSYDPNDYYEVLFGPSLMTGVDLTWGNKIGFGFNAGIGATYNINANYDNITPAIDLGFLIRF